MGFHSSASQFFFKATLLQQVSELLQSIRGQLDAANAMVDELESSIRPIVKELNDLQVKIKNMEHVEEISQKLQQLKKKLAWSWVYDVDKKIQEQAARLEKLKERIPTCQAKIDRQMVSIIGSNVTCSFIELLLLLLALVLGLEKLLYSLKVILLIWFSVPVLEFHLSSFHFFLQQLLR